jgi:hypothetical protein
VRYRAGVTQGSRTCASNIGRLSDLSGGPLRVRTRRVNCAAPSRVAGSRFCGSQLRVCFECRAR